MVGQIQYSDIQVLINNQTLGSIAYDTRSQSNIFTCNSTTPDHLCNIDTSSKLDWYNEIWYEDVNSLVPKYQLANKYNIRGVGMWTAGSLNYNGTDTEKAQAAAMWDAVCQQ